MLSLVEFLEQRGELTTSVLADYVGRYVRERWRTVLQENEDKLLETFERYGEPAYGVYFTQLMRPLRRQFAAAGLSTEPAFPGALPYSVEEWGGEMDDRERAMWFVVSRDGEEPFGTLVVRFFHDHTRFRVPRAPQVVALDETDPEEIVDTLTGGASTDLDEPPLEDVVQEMSASIETLIRENRALRRELGRLHDGGTSANQTNGLRP